jgi:hypothetical protein
VGIIGCDTSHVTAFTETLNNPDAKGHVDGAKVVAAYKGGSQDLPASANRVEEYARILKEKYGVKFYDSIEELCTNVDAVLLESVDGRPHLDQLKPVLKARKPVFIDKPMAGSLRDVIQMFRLAEQAKVPMFSSSALRFATNTQAACRHPGLPLSAETSSPCEIEPHHPDLFWYGIHGVEALYAVMRPGCETVQRAQTSDGRIEVKGSWKGRRSGTYRADKSYHGFARFDDLQLPIGSFDGYAPLLREIVKFFQTGVAPVKPEETIEIFAFMEAADESKNDNGARVSVKEVIKKNGG